MQVTETLKDGLKRGYTITVPAAELQAKVQEKLVEAQPGIEIKGFRKGKVPLAILKKQFGSRLMGDAMQEAIDGAMKSHFVATGDRPALQPDVKMQGGDGWKEGQDVVVDMAYECLPPIPELDASAIALDRLIVKADDASVDEALKNLAASSQSFEDKKKGAKAKDGDQVVIDFKGSVDGVPFDGGAGEDYPLVLGSNSFIPGFEGQLRARSGLALKHGITLPNAPGTIDSDYRGPVGVLLINLGAEPYTIRHGDRIAQLVVAPVVQVRFERTARLGDTLRGADGFGSTGRS